MEPTVLDAHKVKRSHTEQDLHPVLREIQLRRDVCSGQWLAVEERTDAQFVARATEGRILADG
jgi:hypothetical protein